LEHETKVHYDEDADLSIIKDKTIAIIGYGNQGRAHALNMRDSGLNIIIGNIKDEYWERAEKDGFKVYTIDKAAEMADILFILLPDEIQPEVYENHIQRELQKNKVLCFAAGFSIHFGFISPPKFVDVVMEAPRMIGHGVRDTYVRGTGYPTLIGIYQDASGKAKDIVLAIAKASGGTKGGAFMSSFEEEAVLDIFSEQGCFAGMYELFAAHFETAVESGYNPLIVVLELWKSGEFVEEVKAWVEEGFFKQMSGHSPTSQYGSMTRGPLYVTEEIRKTFRKVLNDIQTGVFAREWMMEQKMGKPVFNQLKRRALTHPINKAEEDLDRLIRKK